MLTCGVTDVRGTGGRNPQDSPAREICSALQVEERPMTNTAPEWQAGEGPPGGEAWSRSARGTATEVPLAGLGARCSAHR